MDGDVTAAPAKTCKCHRQSAAWAGWEMEVVAGREMLPAG